MVQGDCDSLVVCSLQVRRSGLAMLMHNIITTFTRIDLHNRTILEASSGRRGLVAIVRAHGSSPPQTNLVGDLCSDGLVVP